MKILMHKYVFEIFLGIKMQTKTRVTNLSADIGMRGNHSSKWYVYFTRHRLDQVIGREGPVG